MGGMTSQHKTFIDLADLTGIRAECQKCGASLLLPILEDKRLSMAALAKCPHCNAGWVNEEEGNGRVVGNLLLAIQRLKESYEKRGCDITLEISQRVYDTPNKFS